MGFWSTLGKIGTKVADTFTGGNASRFIDPLIDGASAGLSSASDAKAQNRGTQIDIEFERERAKRQQEQAFFDAVLQREALRERSAGDAWKRLQQASYITNWDGAQRAPLSPYTRPLQGPAGDIRGMAANPSMWAVLSGRAAYNDPFQGDMPARTPDLSGVEKYRDSGLMEKLLGIGGVAGDIYTGVRKAKTAPKETK